jgi:pyruvate/2-oxoglutarate/acetoin dehydrogenase E1 component
MIRMKELTFPEALNEAIREEMARDPTVFVQGEDVGPYGGGYFPALKGLWATFGGERVRDFPISETALVGTALGAAMTGMRPIVDIMFADFSFVCFDQIVNQIANLRYMSGGKAKVPIVIRGVIGGGQRLASQHSHSLEALFVQFPGLVVVTPSCPRTAKGLLKSAIRNDNPVIFLEHKMLYSSKGPVPEGRDFTLPLGKAQIGGEGSDLTIVAHAYMTQMAMKAIDRLKHNGISAEVVDLLTLSPLDGETILKSVRKTGRVLAVQDAPPMCGMAAEVVALVAEKMGMSLRVAPRRVTAKQAPIPFSPKLEDYVLPSVTDIVEAARGMVRGK